MKALARKKVSARRTWTINPRTRVKESGRIYKRSKEKKEASRLYEPE
ncbi:MAG: hypothetical protein NC938_05830 [Candidatus Omnitrophica bacterium]|nr:hypothetical protein [Candidatus Omnitrophota bacterium]MCM8791197.1 hypothetical protein [Candidatus Omnitrophota bacterium]